MKAKMNASTLVSPDMRRTRAMILLAIVSALSVVSLIGGTTNAAAQTDPNLAMYAGTWVYTLVGFAVTAIVAAGLFYADKKEYAIAVGIVAVVLGALAAGAIIAGAVNTSSAVNCAATPLDPSCKPNPGYVAKFSGLWGCSTTLVGCAQAPHDAIGEFAAAPFALCSASTPASAGVAFASTPARNSVVVNNASSDYTVFGGAATATINAYNDPARVGGTNPSCDAPDIRLTIQNPPPAAAGGYQPVPIWLRVTTSTMTGTINGTVQPVFYCSPNAGPHLFVGLDADSGSATHTTTHRWVSAWNSQPACPGTSASVVGDWIPVGSTSTTTYQNGEWLSFGFILQHSGAGTTGANLGGICDYYNTLPGQTCLTLKIEAGTMPGNTAGWQGNVVYWTYTIIRQ